MKDGGPAFPSKTIKRVQTGAGGFVEVFDEDTFHPGMSLRQYFAIHAPEPGEHAISAKMQIDRNRDPHNDRGLIRSRMEIIAALRYEYADAMIAEGEKK